MEVTPADLLIVTVTHNSAALLPPFGDALREAPATAHLFIDNASTDDSADAVRRIFPTASLQVNRENMGTAAAWNDGLAHARRLGKKVAWILNPDVIVHPGCMEHLLAFLSRSSGSGAVGPVLLFSHRPGTIESYGAWFDMKHGKGGQLHQHEPLGEGIPLELEADYVDGGSCMIRLQAAAEAGPFDPSLFMYGEEADLCFRLRRKGWTVHATRGAVASHRHYELAGSDLPAPRQIYYMTRNHIRLAREHHGMSGFLSATLQELTTGLRQLPRWRRERTSDLPSLWLRGLLDGLAGKGGPMTAGTRRGQGRG